jgi:hypothetical protein
VSPALRPAAMRAGGRDLFPRRGEGDGSLLAATVRVQRGGSGGVFLLLTGGPSCGPNRWLASLANLLEGKDI